MEARLYRGGAGGHPSGEAEERPLAATGPFWGSEPRAWEGDRTPRGGAGGMEQSRQLLKCKTLQGLSPPHLPSPSATQDSGRFLSTAHPSVSQQILLISDYFYAFLRREYYLTHGLYLTAKDGTEAMLVLK